MIGKPKFQPGDRVIIHVQHQEHKGYVYVVDSHGTSLYKKDVCYDVMVDQGEKQGLYKHIPEQYVTEDK